MMSALRSAAGFVSNLIRSGSKRTEKPSGSLIARPFAAMSALTLSRPRKLTSSPAASQAPPT
jgi:hypothetical protein